MHVDFVTRLLDGGPVLFVRMSGLNTPSATRENRERLVARLKSEGCKAMVMDYRRIAFTHDPLQFDHLSQDFAARFPAPFAAGYVVAPAQAGHAGMMIRALQSSGREAQLFATPRSALDWVRERAAAFSGAARQTG